MSLTKTLSPAGVLVEVNGKTLDNPQVTEDIVDEVAALNADPIEVTGARNDGTALASLLTALETKGIIIDSTTAS